MGFFPGWCISNLAINSGKYIYNYRNWIAVDKEQKKRLEKAYLGGPARRTQADAVHREKIPDKPEPQKTSSEIQNPSEPQTSSKLQTPSEPQATTNLLDAFIIFLMISLGVGWIYWGVLTWQLGSWLMVIGLVFFPIGGVLGFWSLVFGTPEWVFYIFY